MLEDVFLITLLISKKVILSIVIIIVIFYFIIQLRRLLLTFIIVNIIVSLGRPRSRLLIKLISSRVSRLLNRLFSSQESILLYRPLLSILDSLVQERLVDVIYYIYSFKCQYSNKRVLLLIYYREYTPINKSLNSKVLIKFLIRK